MNNRGNAKLLWSDNLDLGVTRFEWKNRIIRATFDMDSSVEPWMELAYREYKEYVDDAGYPCYFGHEAEKNGEMFYAFVNAGDSLSLVEIMSEFVCRGRQPMYARYNLGVFFEPLSIDTHERFGDRVWETLQMLHNADPFPMPNSPCDPDWEFSFDRCQMFVVAANPTHVNRRSRCLGKGQVLLFQPRAVFTNAITNEVISEAARNAVRQRLVKWDGMGHHPDLGFYGDPNNREWKQYVLSDDNTPAVEECPFASRAVKREDGR